MEYRQLGTSGIRVPTVSLGAWAIGGWMWGGANETEAVRAIHHALDIGMTCIDTAPVYGMGHSETVVGRALAGGRRAKAIVATKCGLRWDRQDGEFYFDTKIPDGRPAKVYRNLRPESIRHECEQSLKRLQTDVIDIYQCHWPDSTTPIADTMGTLLDLQKEGKIRAIGVSNFTPEMMAECLRYGAIASDQPPYSLLKRNIERDVLPFCIKHTIGVLAYSPLAHGILTGKISLEREFPEGDLRRTHPWFTRENRRRILELLDKMQPIAEDHGATLGQIAVAWVIAQPGVTSALVGARSPAQVEENARAGEIKLTDDESKRLRALAEELTLET